MLDTSSLTAVGRRLHEEHEATLTSLNALETVILAHPPGRPMPVADAAERRALERFVAVIDHDVTRHFDFEEEALFPILRRGGAGDMVDMLTSEHEAIKPLSRRLEAIAAHALKSGFNEATWTEFRAGVVDLMERESFHIQKEEMGMVRALGYFLDEAEDEALARRYDAT